MMESIEDKSFITVDGGVQVTYDPKDHSNEEATLHKIQKFLKNSLSNGFPASILDIKKISSLELSNCSLSDLPKSFKNLGLKKLVLSKNKFELVPTCLYGGLRELEFLDLSFNQIRQFDIEPDCILHLKTLKLNDNSFENIPKWFLTFRCVNLETLDYTNNNATHYNFLKNSFNLALMKIRVLHMRNSCLLDSDFKTLKKFKCLQTLELSNNPIRGNRHHINKFHDLDMLFVKPDWYYMQILYLNHLSIPLFPEGIFYIEALKELYITNNAISWVPDGIEYLVNLEVLDISNNELVAVPPKINLLEFLKIFSAPCNYIEEVPEMPKSLKLLDLYDNFVDQINCDINSIQYIDLEYNFLSDIYLKSNIEKYCEKRNNLRKDFGCTERICQIKDIRTKYCSSPSYSEQDSDTESETCDSLECNRTEDIVNNSVTTLSVTEEENWDDEINKLRKKHPEIGTSDEEWQDEDEPVCPNFVAKPKVYVDDNEWTFIDAD